MIQIAITVLLLGVGTITNAGIYTSKDFSNDNNEARYWKLANELRCLVCQNQSLADSNAELAGDLRRTLFEQIDSGKTDQEIRNFLVSRYGNFVLYQPPVQISTIVLWMSPLVLLLLGFSIFAIWIRANNTRGEIHPEKNSAEQSSIS